MTLQLSLDKSPRRPLRYGRPEQRSEPPLKQVRLRHSVISFDEGDHITAAQAAEIAEQAVRYFGDQYQILYSVHEDAEHIHAHVVMNQVS